MSPSKIPSEFLTNAFGDVRIKPEPADGSSRGANVKKRSFDDAFKDASPTSQRPVKSPTSRQAKQESDTEESKETKNKTGVPIDRAEYSHQEVDKAGNLHQIYNLTGKNDKGNIIFNQKTGHARAVQRCENGLICADHVVLIDGKQVWVIRGILNRF
jgi:hypothetical protein